MTTATTIRQLNDREDPFEATTRELDAIATVEEPDTVRRAVFEAGWRALRELQMTGRSED